jgi:hypothetical protein
MPRMRHKKLKNPRLPLLSLLILECDSDKLANQRLSVADDLDNIVQILPKKLRVEVALIRSKDDLTNCFSEYAQKYRGIKLVVVIAHSNPAVISLAPDLSNTPWIGFAQWLKPFAPQKLVCIACKAGQFPPSRVLFDEISKLTEIYASPVELWIHQVQTMKLLIPYLLMTSKVDSELIRLGQWMSLAANGGVILYIRRRQTQWNQFFQLLGALRDISAAAR